jgi:hypothetical protein
MVVGEVLVAMADAAPALLAPGIGAELMLLAYAVFAGRIDDMSAR